MAHVAYMLGARVVEKHFTLDHAWKGTDHAFSLMPDGMRRLVRDLRRVRPALGDGVKRPLPVEQRPLEKMGKKLVAARELSAGHVLAADDIAIKSPADAGLPPYELDRLVAARAAKLGAACVHGVDDKLAVVEERRGSLELDNVAYVGNDINDAECLRAVGLPVVPADAWPEVKPLARWVLSRPGGAGC